MAPARVRITELRRKKLAGEKIVMLTAYDTPTARLLDGAGVDVVLVGDSVGMAALGHDSTLPVTLDAMVHHASAVSRGVAQALLVADMPFLSYQVTVPDAIRNAGRLLQEGGAAAVKVEGGRPIAEVVRRLVEIGIPVMGHLGVRPQSVHQLGGYARRGAEARRRTRSLPTHWPWSRPALSPSCSSRSRAALGRTITQRLGIPTIGIGAGTRLRWPGAGHLRHARSAGEGPAVRQALCRAGHAIQTAAREFAADVREGRFPAAAQPTARPLTEQDVS